MAVASSSSPTVQQRLPLQAHYGHTTNYGSQRSLPQAGPSDHHRSPSGFDFLPHPSAYRNWPFETCSLSSPGTETVDDPSLAVDQVPGLMNDHRNWQASHGPRQHPQTPRALDPAPAHQRNSSLSTLASAGPSSPYAQHTPHPRIAITDPASDEYSDTLQDADTAIYGVKEPVILYEYPTPSDSQRRQQYTLHRPGAKLLQPHGDLRFAPSSNPVSVASSIASDSPGTPTIDEKYSYRPVNHITPKLDRTMTDIYSDELYNPCFSITSTVSPSTSTTSDIFSRARVAHAQGFNTNSPTTPVPGERSPFRHGSPLAPVAHQNTFIQSPMSASTHSYPSQSTTDCQRSSSMPYASTQALESDSTTTISPKDSMLEFRDPGDTASFPLFPPHDDSQHFITHQHLPTPHAAVGGDGPIPSFLSSDLSNHFALDMENHQSHDLAHFSPHTQASLSAAELPLDPPRPTKLPSGSGTFSCTYQGCPSRFESAALLQKHKREGHRQIHGIGAGRREGAILGGSVSTQNGPHKCLQTNPSTGKPCNTEFSRPYDLTRHEDTIHNPKKRKVTCPICTDKKQFSRGDALSRHYRVCHPELTPPGKRRREADR